MPGDVRNIVQELQDQLKALNDRLNQLCEMLGLPRWPPQ